MRQGRTDMAAAEGAPSDSHNGTSGDSCYRNRAGVGNSAPLALSGFAVTTFMLSMVNANLVPTGHRGGLRRCAHVRGLTR